MKYNKKNMILCNYKIKPKFNSWKNQYKQAIIVIKTIVS